MRQEDAEELQKKIMSAKFDFNDFLKQTRAVARMGSVSRVIGMIPGMGKVWDPVHEFSYIFPFLTILCMWCPIVIGNKGGSYLMTNPWFWFINLKIEHC